MFYNIFKKINQYIYFKKEFNKFKLLSDKKNRFNVNWSNRYPCLNDKTSVTSFDPHYTYHPAWAARVISKIKPKKHIDISSILHFSTIVSAFIPMEFYDYRPANIILDNYYSKNINLLKLPFADNSIESISCMHTIEHIGLGRYGDDMDANGDLKAIEELKRVVSINGSLLFVVPVGKPKIMFNAHRIYSYDQIMSYFQDFKLEEYSLIPDDFKNGIIKNASKELSDEQNYACGCFWFKKY